MAVVLRHRGPDGDGFWISPDNTTGFAHTRLAITDLRPTAAQPMQYLHYTIIFNGEIYNFRELKKELQSKNYHFTTESDTEVIPAAYDCWGINFLHHFDGMFAFALYDASKKETLICRDRFGEKPLYFFTDGHSFSFSSFVFASEMKALWQAGISRQRNDMMMLNYLAIGYVHNPMELSETFFKNISLLAQGHYIIISNSSAYSIQQWYQPLVKRKKIADEAAEQQFLNLFTTSVEQRLLSDVSVGTSLSGGIDSSSVIAAINHALNKKGKTDAFTQWTSKAFTAIFPGFEKDESKPSKEVADYFTLSQYTTAPTSADLYTTFEKLMYYQEEPLQSSSALVQYMVYQLARQHGVTVMLDGQGADEILGGYSKYPHWYLQQLLLKNYSLFKKEKSLLRQNELLEKWGWRNYIAALVPVKTAASLKAKAYSNILHNPYLHKDFVQNNLAIKTLDKPVVKELEDLLYYNTFQSGLAELLRYADRNSMANSCEVRLPFLHHELVEFIFSLPASFKIRNGFTKYILRKTMQNYLPAQVIWQKGKTGFEPPQKKWMQEKQIMEMIMESRKKLIKAGMLENTVMRKPIHAAGAHEARNFDWRCLCTSWLL